MNKPEVIIIHHSATKDGTTKDFNAIKRYHVENLGWRDIGYNWVIERVNGVATVIQGRSENISGAHTKGMNDKSIGICVVGNYDKDNVSTDMYNELVDLIADIRSRYGDLPLKQHSDYANKTCPGLNFPFNQIVKDTNSSKCPQWKEDAVQWALREGVIDSYHDPLEPLDIGSYLEIERKKSSRKKEFGGYYG